MARAPGLEGMPGRRKLAIVQVPVYETVDRNCIKVRAALSRHIAVQQSMICNATTLPNWLEYEQRIWVGENAARLDVKSDTRCRVQLGHEPKTTPVSDEGFQGSHRVIPCRRWLLEAVPPHAHPCPRRNSTSISTCSSSGSSDMSGSK